LADMGGKAWRWWVTWIRGKSAGRYRFIRVMGWLYRERFVLSEMGRSEGRVLWPSKKWGVRTEMGDSAGRWLAF
jgi:hypothetical protein